MSIVSNIALLDRLADAGSLTVDEYEALIDGFTPADRDHATSLAYKVTRDRFGAALYPWGRVSLTNLCSRDCFSCDLCRGEAKPDPFRLTTAEAVARCGLGYELGCRTFLLEAGQDPEFTDEAAEEVIWAIKKKFPDCALTLAFGERSRESLQLYFDAGADRYLLRHDAADPELFARLHPRRLTLANRIRCLEDLSAIGYQTGAGLLVGSPGQTPRHLAQDLAFLTDFRPATVTLAPFLPSFASPRFADEPKGPLGLTLFVLSLVRLSLPDTLLPVMPAMSVAHASGRELAVMAGANVLLPNLTLLNEESDVPELRQRLAKARSRLSDMGYEFVAERGDYDPHGWAKIKSRESKPRSPASP